MTIELNPNQAFMTTTAAENVDPTVPPALPPRGVVSVDSGRSAVLLPPAVSPAISTPSGVLAARVSAADSVGIQLEGLQAKLEKAGYATYGFGSRVDSVIAEVAALLHFAVGAGDVTGAAKVADLIVHLGSAAADEELARIAEWRAKTLEPTDAPALLGRTGHAWTLASGGGKAEITEIAKVMMDVAGLPTPQGAALRATITKLVAAAAEAEEYAHQLAGDVKCSLTTEQRVAARAVDHLSLSSEQARTLIATAQQALAEGDERFAIELAQAINRAVRHSAPSNLLRKLATVDEDAADYLAARKARGFTHDAATAIQGEVFEKLFKSIAEVRA